MGGKKEKRQKHIIDFYIRNNTYWTMLLFQEQGQR